MTDWPIMIAKAMLPLIASIVMMRSVGRRHTARTPSRSSCETVSPDRRARGGSGVRMAASDT